MPCILHWRQNHFVILYGAPQKTGAKGKKHLIADPAKGLIEYSQQEFTKHWLGTQNNGQPEGIALVLSPSPAFYSQDDDPERGIDLTYMFGYLIQYKKLIVQLFIGLGVGSLLQLILPF